MAKLVLCHVAKLSKIKQMWHLKMICSKFAIEVNPFFRPVFVIENDIPKAISKEEIIVSTGNDRELQKLIKCVEEKSIDHKRHRLEKVL